MEYIYQYILVVCRSNKMLMTWGVNYILDLHLEVLMLSFVFKVDHLHNFIFFRFTMGFVDSMIAKCKYICFFFLNNVQLSNLEGIWYKFKTQCLFALTCMRLPNCVFHSKISLNLLNLTCNYSYSIIKISGTLGSLADTLILSHTHTQGKLCLHSVVVRHTLGCATFLFLIVLFFSPSLLLLTIIQSVLIFLCPLCVYVYICVYMYINTVYIKW